MRWLARLLIAIVLVATVVVGGPLLYLHGSLPALEGTRAVPGLDRPVEIRRDGAGVPHIAAASAADAHFALGYVHAQDRLAQMELQRRIAAGRLAELFGPRALDSDRLMRTLGLYRLAEASLDSLTPETRAALDSYSAGVNAFLETHPGPLPLEFVMLRHRPEPWRPADSLVWGKLMGLQLSGGWRGELLRARLVRTMPMERLAELWPPYPDDAPVTPSPFRAPEPLDTAPTAPPAVAPPSASPPAGSGREGRLWDGIERMLAAATGEGGASNVWAIGGQRTVDGRPILANDPHLGLRMPGFWYLARVEAPGLTVAGATVAGVPFVLLGHNGRVAWGMTTTGSDTVDLFLEQIDPDDPTRYRTPDGSRPFETREETIVVRGAPDQIVTVRTTRHGPVISDVADDAREAAEAGQVVALAATFLAGDDRTADALRAMNEAGTADAFEAGLEQWAAPQQNVFFADVTGAYGFRSPGRVPIRAGGDGWMPAEGWTGVGDWTGMVPFRQLPGRRGTEAGYLANANNKVVADAVGGGDAAWLGRDWDPPYRIRRIDQLIEQAPRHRVETSAAMLADATSLMARDLVPLLAAASASTPRTAPVLAEMRQWDGVMDRRRAEPLIFTAWLRELTRLLYADELGPLFLGHWNLHPLFVHRVLTEAPHWCDDRTTTTVEESCNDRVTAALERALDDLERRYGGDRTAWRWGIAHEARFAHRPFAQVPVIGRLFTRSMATDGAYDTLNRGATSIANEAAPFRNVHGAGFRAVYDLADLERSRFMIAIGQSGNPLSPHYSDLAEPWRDFAWRALSETPAATAHRLELRPR